jgi:hypothetical protein
MTLALSICSMPLNHSDSFITAMPAFQPSSYVPSTFNGSAVSIPMPRLNCFVEDLKQRAAFLPCACRHTGR